MELGQEEEMVSTRDREELFSLLWSGCFASSFISDEKGFEKQVFSFSTNSFLPCVCLGFSFCGFFIIYIYINCLFVSLEFEVTPLHSTGCPDFIR